MDKLQLQQEIINLRNELPDKWAWNKCYELSYFEKPYIRKHWALQATDKKGCVFSLGLISIDNWSNKNEFYKDNAVKFVEKAPEMISNLLEIIKEQNNELASLKAQLKELPEVPSDEDNEGAEFNYKQKYGGLKINVDKTCISKLSEVKESVTDELVNEYIKTELPNAEYQFHYEAEGAYAVREFAKWLRSRLQPAQSPLTDEQIEKWAEIQTSIFTGEYQKGYKSGIIAGVDAIQSGKIAEWLKQKK